MEEPTRDKALELRLSQSMADLVAERHSGAALRAELAAMQGRYEEQEETLRRSK